MGFVCRRTRLAPNSLSFMGPRIHSWLRGGVCDGAEILGMVVEGTQVDCRPTIPTHFGGGAFDLVVIHPGHARKMGILAQYAPISAEGICVFSDYGRSLHSSNAWFRIDCTGQTRAIPPEV